MKKKKGLKVNKNLNDIEYVNKQYLKTVFKIVQLYSVVDFREDPTEEIKKTQKKLRILEQIRGRLFYEEIGLHHYENTSGS